MRQLITAWNVERAVYTCVRWRDVRRRNKVVDR